MSHTTTIVFDLDDTISFTHMRDWENAYCDPDMRDKINRLYDDGWTIIIMTARGQISCGGNITAIYAKYHDQVFDWLTRNGVKFHELKFGKPLAAYYVDDKAIRPDEFKDLKIEKLKGGLSGAEIIRFGDRVSKTDPNALNVAAWYRKSVELGAFTVPEFFSVVGDTLTIEYIDGDSMRERPDGYHVMKVADIIKRVSTIPTNSGSFERYADRIKHHLDQCEELNHISIDLQKLYYNVQLTHALNKHSSFCHGDLTLDNIIIRDDVQYFIDPIPMFHGQYSSYLLDISKFIQSCERNNLYHSSLLMSIFGIFDERRFLVELLVLSHWIRMLKYAKTADKCLYERSLKVIETKFIELGKSNESFPD